MTDSPNIPTVAEILVANLQRHGVEYIFAQSLPSALILAAEAIGIKQISYRQENMGGVMADGYARLSGKVGVVAAQNGPAATLLVPPFAEALKASIPLVALVQDVERDQTDKNAFQDFDQIALFQSCTKWVRRVSVAQRIEDYIDAAFTAAASGRPGPVALLLPADLLREKVSLTLKRRQSNLGYWPLDRNCPPATMIANAVEWIACAKTPVVLAGGGVHSSGAADVLSALQEKGSLPVFTTNMGKGAVNETHPLSCGVLGGLTGFGSIGAHTKKIMERADLVLLVGTRTNQNGTDTWKQIPEGARVIHIDVDPTEIGRNYEAMRLVGDAKETLSALVDKIDGVSLASSELRFDLEAEIAACWRKFQDDRSRHYSSEASPVRPERIMSLIQDIAGSSAVVVADASYSSMWVSGQLIATRGGTRFLLPRGLAGLGWGLPLAIGATLATAGDRTVISIVGDGGFAHSWAEIETIIRHNIPVITIVLNNGVLGFQRDAETVKFGKYTSACHFSPVNHAAIASACGCDAVRVDNPEQFAVHLRRGIDSKKPLLIEVMTDPSARPPLSLFATLEDAA